MTKDIRDYLHLYLGCEIEHDKKVYRGTLIGISAGFHTAEIHCDFFKKNSHGHRVPKDKDFGTFHIQICRIKPILRPLSDMSDEEVLELCKTASPTIFGDYRFAKWEANRSPHEMCHWTVTNKNSTYRFNVSSVDGDVYISAEDGDIDLVSIDGNYRFWYLKKGFDIFGLIDAGLAIKKNEI